MDVLGLWRLTAVQRITRHKRRTRKKKKKKDFTKNLSKARTKMDKIPNDTNIFAHNKARAEYYTTKNELQRQIWHHTTSQLNLEKDTTKLWKLTKSLNGDQTPTASNITILQNGTLISGKQAANEFANYYVKTGNIAVTKEMDPKTSSKIKEE